MKLSKARSIVAHMRRRPAVAFVFGFQILVVFSTVELLLENRNLANDLGVYALVSLTIGMVLHTLRVIFHRKG